MQNVGYLLSQLGYKTSFAGKYLNEYGYAAAGGTQHVPRGWDQWIGLVGNSVYYNYNLSVNGANVRYNNTTADYLPTVVRLTLFCFVVFLSWKIVFNLT